MEILKDRPAPSGQDRQPLIRPALESDLETVHAIYSGYVLRGLGSFEETPPPVSELGSRRNLVRSLGLPYLVAEAQGRVVGYCYAAPYRPRPPTATRSRIRSTCQRKRAPKALARLCWGS